MRNLFSKFFLVFGVLALVSLTAFGQTTSTGSLTGTVTDPTGAVVPGATVTVTSTATAQEFNAKTNDEGVFTIPTLTAGLYTATISVKGFKQAKVTEIKIDAGKPSSFNVAMEVGSQDQTVTIVGSAELLQTQTATVGTTLTGRQITDIPTASRNALDLVLALPGTGTPGRPRTSSVNG
ncbi:MAG TPA: carboxypeptidase-like regulatory domain-containing protein, partial [Pyrinomonadaceae bacterium]|nr:carboxypeptidase-like regulatory domain-containing protein [Pyrinomonadaceae bacterium]